jgi:hypothetical protein
MTTPMIKSPPDPVLEEIHATRRRLLADHGGLAGLFAFLKAEEAKSQRPIATPRSEVTDLGQGHKDSPAGS